MFNCLKAKTPVSNHEWEITKNAKGEYFVKYIVKVQGFPLGLHKQNMYFKDKVFGNVVQCERAIYEWQAEQALIKRTHVKYL